MRKNWKLFLYCFILVAVVLLVYLPITGTFYQQDEWLGYGMFLSGGSKIITQDAGGLLGVIFGQGRILNNLLLLVFYKYFPLNVYPIALFAITLHSVNTILVFLLAKKLFKNLLPAFLGGLFFAVSSVSQSAVTWPAASINTLPSTTLILISIMFYFRYLEGFKVKWLIPGFVLIYLSLFFKETGTFLFLLFPLLSVFIRKYSFKNYLHDFWYYFLAAFSIIGFRLIGFLLIPHQEALFLTGSSKYFFDSLVVRSVLYPLTSFSLTIIPSGPFVWFARYIENVYYPFFSSAQFILIAQSVILDLLSVILSICFLAVIVATVLKNARNQIKQVLSLVVLLLSSFLPYVVISKNYSYLESRYYYLPSALWGIIFAWMFALVFKKSKPVLKVIVTVFFLCFTYWHIIVLQVGIKTLVFESQTRIKILDQIAKLKPDLKSGKNIFYVTGDTDYLVPGNKVPFQQGFGYTLMAVYFSDGKIPKDFLKSGYLFEIGSQGYKEEGNFGFGYFTDISRLKEAIKKYGFSKNDVIMLYYHNSEQKIEKIDEKDI